jgi:hypothetical protein
MSSKIDDNFEYVGLAYNATTGLPAPLLVDPTTGYLLATVVFETASDLAVTSKIDENYEGTALATDDSTGLPRPLKVNPTSGALLVTIP